MSGESALCYSIILISLIFYSESVKIEYVGLASGLPYVDFRTPAHFSYNLSMEQNEILESVSWTKDGEPGIYEWTKEGIKNSGAFENATPIAQEDGEFEFKALKLTQVGNYTMTVTTNLGKDSSDFNFIIYYHSSSSLSFSLDLYPRCIWEPTLHCSAIAPYPNISCTFRVSTYGDPYELPAKVIGNIQENITDHYNGTYLYKMVAEIPIEKIPLQSVYVCKMNIKGIQFDIQNVMLSSVSGKPCSELNSASSNYTLKMIKGEKSCHGGYAPLTEFNYTCVINPEISGRTMTCKEGRWQNKDKMPWPDCRPKPTVHSGHNDTRMSVTSSSLLVLLSLIMVLALVH